MIYRLKIIFVLVLIIQGCREHAKIKERIASDTFSRMVRDSITSLDSLASVYYIGNPTLSLAFARKAIMFAKTLQSPTDICLAYNAAGQAHYSSLKDSSFYFFTRALALADSIKYLKIIPQLLYNLSEIYLDAGNYKTSLKLLDSCIQVAVSQNDFKNISASYNVIGLIQVETGDSLLGYKMFSNALNIAIEHNLYRETGNALGNLALYEKDYSRMMDLYRGSIRSLGKVRGTAGEIAMVYMDMGVKLKNPDSSKLYYRKALAAIKNNLPVVSIAAYNNLAYAYMDHKELVQAILCIRDTAIPLAIKYQNDDWLATLYDTFGEILSAKGDFKTAYEYERMRGEERDKVYSSKNKQQIRLLSAMLDLKNKECNGKHNKQETCIVYLKCLKRIPGKYQT